MIKTLRITSIIAAILAVGLLVFPTVFGFRSNEEIEQFLSSPTVVERFREAERSGSEKDEPQVSPLVKQAELFALYLNPPKPPPPEKKIPELPPGKQEVTVIPTKVPTTTKARFTAVATSFYESCPEMSLVLVDEPGKGRHWVRQGSKVGHLTIEQIKDGLLIVKGGKETFEVGVELRPLRRSLLASPSPVSIGVGGSSTSVLGPLKKGPVTGADAGIESTIQQMSPEEQTALAEKIFAEMEAMYGGVESQKIDSKPAQKESPAANERLSDPEATRISGEEAKKLSHLGQELKDPNQANIREDRRELIRRRIEERKRRARERAEQRLRADNADNEK